MSNPVYTRRLAETLGSDALTELTLDLRWSFSHAADTIWQRLIPYLESDPQSLVRSAERVGREVPFILWYTLLQ